MKSESESLKEAVLWEKAADNKTQCFLCSHRCLIADGKVGFCAVRKNIGGKLYSLNYYKVCSANIDPIEKKPLYHFQPGSKSFSIAAEGCNFRCEFCQNWQISQAVVTEGRIDGEPITPQQLVDSAVHSGCKSIAYTYTEPTIFMELCADTGRLAKQNGLANVFVSNGYQTKEAVDFAKDWLDGVNVDLKAFNEKYYHRLCKAKLQPVLDTIEYIARHTNIWMEITTLLLPGENDSQEELQKLADFLVTKAGPDVPWHISRFFPQYKYLDSVPTPMESLKRAYDIGKAAGLHYVYMGNVPSAEGERTYCHKCSRLLIDRLGYRIVSNVIKNGCCSDCSTKIPGFQL
jgi:pyruvate formate lyase activating enzyme